MARNDFHDIMWKAGIDGIYDQSFCGVVIFKKDAVRLMGLSKDACASPKRGMM